MALSRSRAPRRPANRAGDVRRPMQERGERRVSAVLDAAAELVAEVGVEGITVQALAERSRTSKGSLYHFFPDVPSVLRALATRHSEAITALIAAMIADDRIDWARLTVVETVERFLAPLDYLEANPDLLALVRAPNVLDRSGRGMQPIRDFACHILERRFPRLTLKRRKTVACMLVAVVDGVVSYGARCADASPSALRAELERVLEGYLRALDD